MKLLLCRPCQADDSFTERQIEQFAGDAKRRWDISELLIIHRVGHMLVGEPIVLVKWIEPRAEDKDDLKRWG